MTGLKTKGSFNFEKTHMLLKSHMNRSESHLPVNEEMKRNALSPAQKEKLLRMVVDAFMNPVKIDMEEVMKNKWLKWKYKDQIEAEDKRRSKWLEEAEDSPNGFAIGRRIFEKAEIVDGEDSRKVGEIMKSLPSNYDLKNAQEDYKLWDKVHAKEVMAHLVMLSRWEPPGKKEIERRKMLEAKKAKLEAKEETNEEKLNKIEQLNTLAKGKKCWGKAKGIVRLSGLEMFSCMNATRFDKQGINKWHKAFFKECPDGKLTRDHLTQLFKRVYPSGDAEKFCNHVFRVFNDDDADHLDFKKFIMAMDVTYCQTEQEKLQWAFRLYDIDESGFIDRQEIESIIRTMDQVEGRSFIKSVLDGNSKIKLKPVATRADEIMTSFDANKDGLISRDEFTEGYMKMHTTKTGKRRWSRGIGIWQTKALNMDKIIKGSNSEK